MVHKHFICNFDFLYIFPIVNNNSFSVFLNFSSWLADRSKKSLCHQPNFARIYTSKNLINYTGRLYRIINFMLVCIFFLIVFVHIAMDNFVINKHWFGFVRVICNSLNEFWFSTTKHTSHATVGFPIGILHGASAFSFIPFFRFLSLLTHILCCQKLRDER